MTLQPLDRLNFVHPLEGWMWHVNENGQPFAQQELQEGEQVPASIRVVGDDLAITMQVEEFTATIRAPKTVTFAVLLAAQELDSYAWIAIHLETLAASHHATAIDHSAYGRFELAASFHGLADGLREAVGLLYRGAAPILPTVDLRLATSSDLAAEIRRRQEANDLGKCGFCGAAYDAQPCRDHEQHNAAGANWYRSWRQEIGDTFNSISFEDITLIVHRGQDTIVLRHRERQGTQHTMCTGFGQFDSRRRFETAVDWAIDAHGLPGGEKP